MIHARGRWTIIAVAFFLVVATGLLAACGGTASTAGPATPRVSAQSPTSTKSIASFQVTFHEQDAPFTCPPGQPPPFACLTFTGQGQATELGAITLVRQALVAAATESTGCHLVTSSGHLTAANHDRLTFTAPGDYCAATDTASYTYTITGGSGLYTGASGTGTITVQAATSSANGVETRTEIWSGTLIYPGIS